MWEEEEEIETFEIFIKNSFLDFRIEENEIQYYLKDEKSLVFDLDKYNKMMIENHGGAMDMDLHEYFFKDFVKAFKEKYEKELEAGDLTIYTEVEDFPMYNDLKDVHLFDWIMSYVFINNPEMVHEWYQLDDDSNTSNPWDNICEFLASTYERTNQIEMDSIDAVAEQEYVMEYVTNLISSKYENYPMPIIIEHEIPSWDDWAEFDKKLEDMGGIPWKYYAHVYSEEERSQYNQMMNRIRKEIEEEEIEDAVEYLKKLN